MSQRIHIPESIAAHFGAVKAPVASFPHIDDAILTMQHEEEVFLAIDPYNPDEVDDAVQVRSDGPASFIVKVAKADGSLIPRHFIEGATATKRSKYGPRTHDSERKVTTLYPADLSIGALSLGRMTPRPSLVSTLKIDAQSGATLVDLRKKLVTARQTTYNRLENRAVKLDPTATNWPLLRAVNAYRESLGLPSLKPGGPKGVRIMSNYVVEHLMVATNIAIAMRAQQHNLPILYRNFKGDVVTINDALAEETGKTANTKARYSTVAVGHAAFNGLPYIHATTPLARTADTITHHQVGPILDDGQTDSAFSAKQLDEYADRLNR